MLDTGYFEKFSSWVPFYVIKCRGLLSVWGFIRNFFEVQIGSGYRPYKILCTDGYRRNSNLCRSLILIVNLRKIQA